MQDDNRNEEILKEFPPYDVEKLTKEEILGDTVINYLLSLEDDSYRAIALEKVKEKAREFKIIRSFSELFKKKSKKMGTKTVFGEKNIIFPGMEVEYVTSKYELDNNGRIYEIIPDVGRILVCYHPILPVQTYVNLEDGSNKVKLAFYRKNKWNYIIVDKSTIASSQSIVKLSDVGIKVNSENAKFLVKYLAEIESLNENKIPESTSVSRLGWFDGELIPYSKKYEIDCVKDMPNLDEMFAESGKLEDWINYFKEIRKKSVVTRITMASSVVSIVLSKIKQPGFTLHVYGESEYGKSVSCMVAQSIFGNPSLDGKGIGINFNFTINGLESALNKYNNLPLFVNEMQHQKDAKDYDKILFLVAEGQGKTRSNKNFRVARQNNWHNVVITNGEKNIIKDNSNAGAYNRCFAYELKDYSFDDLEQVADFVKENYGTPIRKILKELNNYDVKSIFKTQLEKLSDEDTTNKQKIIQALIFTGDKIVTDILFKDEYYLTIDDLADSVVKRKDVATEERALDVIKDWYVSEARHFWTKEDDKDDTERKKVEIYGREVEENKVAFISTILKNKLNDNGFDANETINAWKRKGYLDCEKGRVSKNARIGGKAIRCVILRFKDNEEKIENEEIENLEMPF